MQERRTTPEDIWKNQAHQHFSPEEIREAKEMLWEVCGENVLGKQIQRQGASKQKSEIDDISKALKILSEKQLLPVFVGTANMIMRNPISKNVQDNTNLLSIEKKVSSLKEDMEKFSKSQSELVVKNHARVMSKADVEIKKLEEVTTLLTQNRENLDRIFNSKTNQVDVYSAVERPRQNIIDKNISSQPMDNFEIKGTYHNPIHNGQAGNNMLSAGRKPNISNGGFIDLVVRGIEKEVTERQLYHNLHQRGLPIIHCKLLTTYEHARTLTFKVTIDKFDLDKSRNPLTWPSGSTVSLFKERSEKSYRKSRRVPIKTHIQDARMRPNLRQNVLATRFDSRRVGFVEESNWPRDSGF